MLWKWTSKNPFAAPILLRVLRSSALASPPLSHRDGSDWVPRGHSTLLENSSLARAVLEYLQVASVGMRNFYWPCRMETLSVKQQTVILDGCHNQQSVHLFLKALHELYPMRQVVILFGAGAEKCVDEMVQEVLQGADR